MPGIVAMLPERLQAHDIPTATYVMCIKNLLGFLSEFLTAKWPRGKCMILFIS